MTDLELSASNGEYIGQFKPYFENTSQIPMDNSVFISFLLLIQDCHAKWVALVGLATPSDRRFA